MLREITNCEVCSHPIEPVMDLGPLTLPDDLVSVGDTRVCEKYPTEVMFCDICKTAQLKHRPLNTLVFPPEYHYRAANTKDVLSGMEGFVDAIEKHGLVKGLKVLDIGCNDGSLLDAFARRGALTFGIEPTDAAKEAQDKGHLVKQTYFNLTEAGLYRTQHGWPDLITFTNVFAHIDGLPRLLGALKFLLGPETRIVIENHYLGSVLERNQFDTFYHEHPRTYSYTSFVHIASTLGMHVQWVEFPARYGGNIRVFIYPGRVHSGVAQYLDREHDFRDGLVQLGSRVKEWQHKKRLQLLETIVNKQLVARPIAASAFPGRAAILLQLLNLDVQHIHAVYEIPRSKKIGHYAPGTRIPIVSDADFNPATRGPVFNFAWHIPNEIEARWRSLGYRGEFIQAIEPGDFA